MQFEKKKIIFLKSENLKKRKIEEANFVTIPYPSTKKTAFLLVARNSTSEDVERSSITFPAPSVAPPNKITDESHFH